MKKIFIKRERSGGTWNWENRRFSRFRNAPEIVKILKVRTENKNTKTFTIDKKISPKPGQFFMLWIPEVGQKPFSFSNFKDRLEITVKGVGEFSNYMLNMKKGDFIGIQGPYGKGFKIFGKNICVVAGGMGAIPLISLIENNKKSRFTTVVGAKTKNELLFVDRFKRSTKRVIVTTDDGSYGINGFTTDILNELLKKKKFNLICSCGPEPMMKKVLDLALKYKIPCQLSLERYMKCGFGICGSCCLDPSGLRVCKEGPVFNEKQLIKSEFGNYTRDASGSKCDL